MAKIKVIHHAKTVGYSGTDRTCQIFAKYLAKGQKYEPFLLYREGDSANTRLEIVKEWIGEDHVIPYKWEPGKRGRQAPYLPDKDNYFDVVESIQPQIVHYHAGGLNEWPIFKYLSPNAKIVTTNIFGYVDHSKQADLVVYITDYVKNLALEKGGPQGPVLYNPVEMPPWDMTPETKAFCREFILDKYKLPKNAIILTRLGRPDPNIFDPIALKAFKDIESKYPNAYYIIATPCSSWIEWTKRLNLKNVIFSEPIIDDDELWKFRIGTDIYCHARSDGDSAGLAIAENMMAGIPVISHESPIYNGQAETIGDAGFVVPFGDHKAYANVIATLIENQEFASEDEKGRVRIRDHFGLAARRRAMRHFEASCLITRLEKIYDSVLSN